MAHHTRIEFGYSPPVGDRGIEVIRPRDFVADLQHVLDVATKGFTSIWVSDHLMFETKFRMECWTELVWIAARYPTVMLSTVVLCNSFRNPALLAKMGASLQAFSSGRFILGYGAGWHEDEFRAYGYGFPPPPVRVDMLEEGIQVIRAMWQQSPASFAGKYYQITDAYCEPRPDPIPPLMIGGGGEKRTLRLVARYADLWNDTARPVDVLRHKLSVLRDHCQTEGRDYDRIRKTIMIRVFINKSHKAALARGGDMLTSDNPALVGDPSAIREQLDALADLGIDLCQLVFPNFPETDDMQLFLDEVQPHFS